MLLKLPEKYYPKLNKNQLRTELINLKNKTKTHYSKIKEFDKFQNDVLFYTKEFDKFKSKNPERINAIIDNRQDRDICSNCGSFRNYLSGSCPNKCDYHPAWNKGLTKETDSRVKSIPSPIKGLTKENNSRLKKLSESLKGNIPWNKGIRTGQVPWNKGLTKETDERLQKMGEYHKGKNNFKHKTEEEIKEIRLKQSNSMKKLIADGKFTPCVTNSWANSKVRIKTITGKKISFRSTWEALFWITKPHLEFEKIRVPYIGLDNKKHSYIVDFVDYDKKILYEVKPDSNKEDETVVLKQQAATIWCNENNYENIFISNNFFINNINNIESIFEKMKIYFDEKDQNKLKKSIDNFKRMLIKNEN